MKSNSQGAGKGDVDSVRGPDSKSQRDQGFGYIRSASHWDSTEPRIPV